MVTTPKVRLWRTFRRARHNPRQKLKHFGGFRRGASHPYYMNFYYTYILLSERDSKFYIGYTDDLKRRVKEHNSGKIEATKDRLPFKLVYFEACLSKKDATRRELALKSGFGRDYLKRRLKDYLSTHSSVVTMPKVPPCGTFRQARPNELRSDLWAGSVKTIYKGN